MNPTKYHGWNLKLSGSVSSSCSTSGTRMEFFYISLYWPCTSAKHFKLAVVIPWCPSVAVILIDWGHSLGHQVRTKKNTSFSMYKTVSLTMWRKRKHKVYTVYRFLYVFHWFQSNIVNISFSLEIMIHLWTIMFMCSFVRLILSHCTDFLMSFNLLYYFFQAIITDLNLVIIQKEYLFIHKNARDIVIKRGIKTKSIQLYQLYTRGAKIKRPSFVIIELQYFILTYWR